MAGRPVLEIARREFLEHVLSWRFLIALVLSTLILTTSIVALSVAYQEDVAAFNDNQATLARSSDSWSTTLLQINRWLQRPNVLSIFVGGAGDEYRAESASTGQPGLIRLGGQSYDPEAGSNSPTNTRFTPLDLGFVAVVVMTFMAVIFSYDAVSGERERGTLKLVLSNPVPKDAVLMGKYLGGMASILVPFLLSVVVGLAVLSSMGVTLAAGAWVRLGALVGLFLLMLSAFYLIGLLVSSVCRRSGTSLLALTLVWLILVFGAGNVAAVAAKTGADTIGEAELQERYRQLDDRARAEAAEYQDENHQLFQKSLSGNLTEEEQQRQQELSRLIGAAYERSSKEREELRVTAARQLDSELSFAESIAAFSPAEAFRNLATSVARSDYWSFRDLADAAQEYQSEVERARAEWQASQPPPDPNRPPVMITCSVGGFCSGGEDGFEPPEFNYAPQGVAEQLSEPRGMRDLLVLIGYNLVAFVGAYVAFLRYDVR